MAVRVHTRRGSINDGLRELIETKVANSTRIYSHVGDVDVEFDEEPNPRRAPERYRLEVTTLAAGHRLRVEGKADTPESALDLVVHRLERQLRRLKDRMVRSRQRRPSAPPADDQLLAKVATDEDDEPRIVRTKQFVMKPMSAEEAILQLELLDHDFFLFTNVDTDRASVLYRRRDGDYGLIEPA